MRVDGVVMVPLTGMLNDLTWDLAMAWKPRGARRALLAFVDPCGRARRIPAGRKKIIVAGMI
ncbi:MULTISPECIES: hypothetical protein [Sinorhizobium/Ensifer group]|jgi:hypothetical protein|uniref:hypothetical protein n=1 Tax=Sinorhizobium/Ensifer group TaxID=227292 RepID=UPI00070A292F|nr:MULTISPECIES: hypothetical protein [Sinorhizobium/Ensifer group]KRD63317.1 hypothetical protein ASE60_31450 [Ensifer sp. Root278]KSV95111.1 hypothetical protein N184_35670 [Sinorhizobium sp. GL28]MBV7521398.1 hypothetical protein [Ensifer sp. ENS12]